MAQRRTLYYDGERAIWRDALHGVVRGTLAEAAQAFAGAEAIMLLPGEDILLTRVALPPIRQARRRLTAVRFALEDQLAGRIETLHFAPATATAGRSDTPVAVIDLEHMQALCDDCEAVGLDLVRLLPDALALPAPDDGAWQIALFADRVLARTGTADGFACARDLWPTLTASLAPPSEIHIQATAGDAIQAVQAFEREHNPPTPVPHTHASENALIGLLLDNPELARQPINLRQGEFARSSQFEARWRPFVLTAALAAIWLVVVIAGRVIETWQLDSRIDTLHAQEVSAFHAAFPQVQTINDLQAQAEEGIASLQGGAGGGGLFTLLQATAAVTGTNHDLQVQDMQYQNGQLSLTLTGKNVQAVEALRAGFAQQPGVKLTVQSTDASSAGVQIQASLAEAQHS